MNWLYNEHRRASLGTHPPSNARDSNLVTCASVPQNGGLCYLSKRRRLRGDGPALRRARLLGAPGVPSSSGRFRLSPGESAAGASSGGGAVAGANVGGGCTSAGPDSSSGGCGAGASAGVFSDGVATEAKLATA